MLRTFKNQLTAFTFSIILLISLVFALLCYTFIYKNILSVAISYNNQLSNQLCENIELFLDGIRDATESLSRTSALRFYGSNFITPDIVPTRDEIKADLWKTIENQGSIDDISVVYNQEKMISLYNMYGEEDLLGLTEAYDQSQALLTPQFIPVIHYNKNGHPALSCIKLTSSSDSPCYIISSVTIDEVFHLMQNIDLGKGSGACLVDSSGSVQYSTVTDSQFQRDMNTLIKEKNFALSTSFVSSLNSQDYIISVYPLSDSRLSTVVYIPLSNVTNGLFPLLLSMLGSILLIMVIFSLISLQVSNHLAAPIITLAESKRKAELSALQSQINPHFLYNTLDSINALTVLSDSREISEMITSLGKLLRLSIDTTSEYLTLQDEFNHVKAYIAIQKIRYEESFSVDFSMDRSIADFPIIRLILQPLVENCIYHGLEPLEAEGHILISAKDFSDFIEIQIQDNGKGVDTHTEAVIRQNLLQRKHPCTKGSVGIYNVNERLHLYYGRETFMTFESVLDKGTTVTLHIPKKDFSKKETAYVENYAG